MSITLGGRSLANLTDVHPDLVRVVRRAAELATADQDFTVLEGVRTPARQAELYAQGRTKPGPVVTWVHTSNHFKKPDGYGHACDIAPWPIDWNNAARFNDLAGLMFEAAKIERVAIRWGADWDRDGNPRERGETDSPHFELAPPL